MNLAEFVHVSADRHGRRPAVTDVRSSRSLSYEELARETQRIARFLQSQGIEPGQRIGLCAPNGLAYLPAAFADGALQRKLKQLIADLGIRIVSPLIQSLQDEVMARLDAISIEDLCQRARAQGVVLRERASGLP